jgi:hypothetical protein
MFGLKFCDPSALVEIPFVPLRTTSLIIKWLVEDFQVQIANGSEAGSSANRRRSKPLDRDAVCPPGLVMVTFRRPGSVLTPASGIVALNEMMENVGSTVVENGVRAGIWTDTPVLKPDPLIEKAEE